MGKLGGLELNYSSDIDLIFLYDSGRKNDGKRQTTNHRIVRSDAPRTDPAGNRAHRVGQRISRRFATATRRRARPDGCQPGKRANYYDLRGRTWERQAFIKARPVAGSMELGKEFLERADALDNIADTFPRPISRVSKP